MSNIDPRYYQMRNKLNAVVLAGGGSLQTTFRFDGFPFNMEKIAPEFPAGEKHKHLNSVCINIY